MRIRTVFAALSAIIVTACSTAVPRAPVTMAPQVDLKRFMGDWYVIANVPTFLEKGAHNAVESYKLDADGSIAVHFSFNDGAFDGPLKTYTPRGFVLDATNALWGMQFIWPIKAEYLIAYVDEQYTQTIIARNARDYVWIMARTPQIADAEYRRLLDKVAALGYDMSKVQRVPQQWP